MNLERPEFEAFDAADPLAPYRDRFKLPEGLTYLNGNSLGPLPRMAAQRMQAVVEEEWGEQIIRGWVDSDWVNIPLRVGNKIARLIGAEDGEVIVADSTSVNLFKLACGALAMRPGRRTVLSESGNFPTDLHVLQGIERLMGERMTLRTAGIEEMLEMIDDDTALVVLTHVHYKSGVIHDMKEITTRAHEKDALMLWDLSHTAGAMPVDLNGAGVDLAVGCGYKYLNGGPGAPAFLYVARRHIPELGQPLTGWFGHADPFSMSDDYIPDPGIKRTLCGTTPVLGASALEVGVDIGLSADMGQVREKSMKMGDLFIRLVDERCRGMGFEVASPRDASGRGSQVSLTHDQGHAIMQALRSRGVIGDFRAPDILRFGFSPLYTRYVDVWDAASHLVAIMESGEWDHDEFRHKGAVT